jgi:uncharacterized membrane protein HdeD (DUF308 family)
MWKLGKKSALARLIGGIMAPNRVAGKTALFTRSTDLATGSPKEAIMATAASGKNILEYDPARCDALSEVLAERWWVVGLRGIFGIIFGLICLLVPAAAILGLVLLFSAYMLVDGGLAIYSAIKAAQNGDRWGLLILEGIVDIAAGVVAFLWPAITAVAFVLLIAVWALVSGALMLVAAFRLNIDHGRWWLALGGIASIIFGVVLIIAPVVGAVVLTWWLGAYALVFGVLLLVLAFQLHSRREEKRRKPAAAAAAKKA